MGFGGGWGQGGGLHVDDFEAGRAVLSRLRFGGRLEDGADDSAAPIRQDDASVADEPPCVACYRLPRLFRPLDE